MVTGFLRGWWWGAKWRGVVNIRHFGNEARKATQKKVGERLIEASEKEKDIGTI